MRYVNMYVRVSGRNSLHSFRSGDKRQQLDLFISPFLYEVNCRLRAAAGSQSGVYDYAGAVYAVFGKFAVVFVRFKRFFVAVKTDMTYFRRRKKRGQSVYHS